MSIDQFTEIELANEEWRDAIGYYGIQVSDLGRLRTRWRNSGPKRWLVDEWQLKSQSPDSYGYMQSRMPGNSGLRLVHQLVLEAFIGPKPPGLQCRHKDGVNTNNRATNLIWGTYKENTEDRVRHGTTHPGESNAQSVLKDADVIECRKLYATGNFTMAELGHKIGADFKTLQAALVGRTYKHLPGAIPLPEGRKKRGNRSGEKNPAATITNETAKLIRSMNDSGIARKEICEKTGATYCVVGKVIRGDSYRDITFVQKHL